jgi:urea transporter
MMTGSVYYALCTVIGTVASTVTAQIMGLNKPSIANGIYGYNGALVGVALAYYHFGNDKDFFIMP